MAGCRTTARLFPCKSIGAERSRPTDLDQEISAGGPERQAKLQRRNLRQFCVAPNGAEPASAFETMPRACCAMTGQNHVRKCTDEIIGKPARRLRQIRHPSREQPSRNLPRRTKSGSARPCVVRSQLPKWAAGPVKPSSVRARRNGQLPVRLAADGGTHNGQLTDKIGVAPCQSSRASRWPSCRCADRRPFRPSRRRPEERRIDAMPPSRVLEPDLERCRAAASPELPKPIRAMCSAQTLGAVSAGGLA